MGYLAQSINELYNWLLLWGTRLPAIHLVLLLNSPCENIPVRSMAARASPVLISERVSQAGCMLCPDSLS
jgi:hypothetical protein